MNILNIISEIEKVDPEVYGRLDSRRAIFKHMSGIGSKLATAALPLAVGSIFSKAYAQTGTTLPAGIADILNFALSLEHLEANFYNRGISTTQGAVLRQQFSANNQTALTKIMTDENNHVTFLRSVLGSQAIPVPAITDFDYTAGGRVADVFTNPASFLAVAQAFEDTGVRAYKGGAPGLMSNATVLEAALNIHSVEARHASRIRTMRRGVSPTNATPAQSVPGTRNAAPKSWISGNDANGPVPGFTDAVYGPGAPAASFPGEDNVMQATANITTLLTAANITGLSAANAAIAATEAFDEPLDVATVKAIARNFVIPSSTLFR